MREIPSQEWSEFCRRLNEFERDATIRVERLESDGRRTELARNALFEQISFGKQDDCNDHIAVRCSGTEGANHNITEPIYVRLQETETGNGFTSVIIGAEQGVTILTFHPAIRARWLEGLQIR